MPADLRMEPDVFDKAISIGGEKTMNATVNHALRNFIVRRGRKRPVDLLGRLDWDDYDYKHERERSPQ